MKSKAQIQIQFNWIFVIIIGAILLGFFFTMIFTQTNNNEKQVSATIARHFETIITSTNQKIGTVKTYKIPLSTVKFTCDDFQGIYQYDINGIKAKDIKYEPIFSSNKLYGTKIYTWTKNWNLPYQVATFLYITNDKEHFSFVLNGRQPSAIEQKLISDFAPNMSVSIINRSGDDFENVPTDSMNMNKYKYIVLLNTNNGNGNKLPAPDKFIKVPTRKAEIILIIPEIPSVENFFDFGTVKILNYKQYQKLEQSTSIDTDGPYYLSEASLFAAIFTDNEQRYECEMNKALHKLEIISEIQKYKILNENNSIKKTCRQYLIGNSQIKQLKGAIFFIEDIINKINSTTKPNLNNIYEDIKLLKKKNNDVVIEAQCPPIY